MAPRNYLDIHGHFYFPSSPSDPQAQELEKAFKSVNFLVDGPVYFSTSETLSLNDTLGIKMQMLSYIPTSHDKLTKANDYGHSIVKSHPDRFGLLAALPTDDADACLAEIARVTNPSAFNPAPDGFATTTVYNGIPLSDERLDPVWSKLDSLSAVVHVHPNAYADADMGGRAAPLVEVAFDTARVATAMLYRALFKSYPSIKFVFAHCGGALPVLSGRLQLLGTDPWVHNPSHITRDDMIRSFATMYVDTAATAKTGMKPAVDMVGPTHVVFGSDCGVPCSNERTLTENMHDVVRVERELGLHSGLVATNGWALFPRAAERAGMFGTVREMPQL